MFNVFDGVDGQGLCSYCYRTNQKASKCRRRTCNYCRKAGHVINECRLKQRYDGDKRRTHPHESDGDQQRAHSSLTNSTVENRYTLAWCSLVSKDHVNVQDTEVYAFLDTAASSGMVGADSKLGHSVEDTRDCNVGVQGSCGEPTAKQEERLDLKSRSLFGDLVSIYLEALLVSDLGASLLCGSTRREGRKFGPVT